MTALRPLTLALILASTMALGLGLPDPPEALLLQSWPEPVAAPPVIVTDLAGGRLDLERFRGRPLFLNFWATWCVPCREEMPALDRLHDTYGNGRLVVLVVNFKESAESVQTFVRAQKLALPVALDRDGSASQQLRVRGLPESFLIDAQGRLVWRAIGARPWDSPAARVYFGRLLGAAGNP